MKKIPGAPAALVSLDALQISERERTAIGQQLHDDTCQVLTGLACLTEALAKQTGTTTAQITRQQLRWFGRELRTATKRVRAMAHTLVPAPATQRGLRYALKEATAQAALLYPVKIKLRLPSVLLPHRGNHVVQLHGITQESIANAIRHGAATALQIRLRGHGKNHVLEIVDNGSGLPRNFERKRGIGMHLMNQRAKNLGGSLSIENIRPRGVRVRIKYTVV